MFLQHPEVAHRLIMLPDNFIPMYRDVMDTYHNNGEPPDWKAVLTTLSSRILVNRVYNVFKWHLIRFRYHEASNLAPACH